MPCGDERPDLLEPLVPALSDAGDGVLPRLPGLPRPIEPFNPEQINLVGLTEIAQLLGVSRQRAYQLANAPGFPKPVERLAQGAVWRRSAVEKWAEKNR